ncbi:esterase-like activity of phytase family protein [Mesobacterium pallidum]|uniref:esterase-like activity of phytase family protein n=1 Tax=Mesobacterium pallidum TaxID=2872037 RepID=UPI001EE1B239|nr:esterase-like activity of phytase family protein [Mesobacterium pallidum]
MGLRLTAVVASLAALTLTSSAEVPWPASFLSRHTWSMEDDRFGGWSGLELSADGTRFTAISDRSYIITGTITRKGSKIIGVTAEGLRRLDPGRKDLDSEGLAIAGDGTLYFSSENTRDVRRLDATGSTPLPQHDVFKRLPGNGGLEALAIGPDGTLYALPERGLTRGAYNPVFRFQNGAWGVPHLMLRSDGFVPVGADVGPDGALYVLERAFSGLGFSSRVRRVHMTGEAWSDEVLLQTPTGRHDNLEGLAVWRDDAGRIRLTMISDDNYRFFQRTEVVDYALTE